MRFMNPGISSPGRIRCRAAPWLNSRERRRKGVFQLNRGLFI
jgi:hypothetical protein